MVSIQDIEKACDNRKIIIVGNSSRLLKDSYAKIIDSYEIVVRINRGYQPTNLYSHFIGTKTNFLSLGVKSEAFARRIILGNHIPYILCPIMYSDKLHYPNAYHVEKEVYQSLKNELGNNKPSTGIATFNFFNKLNNFQRLDLIGFDFFESSGAHRNQLGHLRVPDHNGREERGFFDRTRDVDRTHIHPMAPGGAPINNIPKYSNIRFKRR